MMLFRVKLPLPAHEKEQPHVVHVLRGVGGKCRGWNDDVRDQNISDKFSPIKVSACA